MRSKHIIFRENYPWPGGALVLGKALNRALCAVGANPERLRTDKLYSQGCPVVLLCLGGLEVPGDTLGPRIGTQLKKRWGKQPVYGTMEHPLDSRNLQNELTQIKQTHPGALWLAIDAAVGDRQNIGQVTVRCGPILPGIGLGFVLPALGEVSLTGIVAPRKLHWWQRPLGRRSDAEAWAKTLSVVMAEGIIIAFELACGD